MTPPLPPSSVGGPTLLGRPLPAPVRMALLVIAGLIPTLFVLSNYNAHDGFTSLIFFGRVFRPTALEQIREINPAATSQIGYDGQFYAQIALTPLLRDPHIAAALDSPTYRARRILMPSMAYVLGLGSPGWILNAFALLNLGFWFLLLFGMLHFLRALTAGDYLCIFASVFTTGCVVSLERSLTDLPAATLGFYATACEGAVGTLALTASLLARETSVLLLLRFAPPSPMTRSAAMRLLTRIGLILTPLLLWLVYVRLCFGKDAGTGVAFFGMPFASFLHYLRINWHSLAAIPFAHREEWIFAFYNFMAPVSLMFQAIYLFSRPALSCKYWRIGFAFALIYILLDVHIIGRIGICRTVIPMTLAFNIRLMAKRGIPFAVPYIVGNLGLLSSFWML